MNRIFVPSLGPADWRRLLGDPSAHWVRGRSAYEVAVSWEAARGTPRGLPREVAEVVDGHPEVRGAELLFGVPEHRVALPGGGHASQTDFWALLRSNSGLASLAIEAKSSEPFGPAVKDWVADQRPGSGKPDRLLFLRQRLGLSDVDIAPIRYQLLHRATSAILEAERFRAGLAVLLVQSFGGAKDAPSFSDFRNFGALFSLDLSMGRLHEAKISGGGRLLLGWVASPCAEPHTIADTV